MVRIRRDDIRRVAWTPWGLACLLMLAPSWAAAQQNFRLETDVFLDDGKEPLVQTLTIFADGVVYDFLLTGDEEITMLDLQRGRLVLLNGKRRVKTTLTTESLRAFTAEMKTRLNDAQREYLLAANMKAEYVEAEKKLTLSNDRVTYAVIGQQAGSSQVAEAYRQFANWYARLNAMRQGNLPPFARQQLNEQLAQRQLIPQRIERTVVLKSGLKERKQVLRSQHLANWRLSNTDRKLIDKAGSYLAEFRAVSFGEYLQLPAVAARGE